MVEGYFGGGYVGAEEPGDGFGIELLGVAGDDDYEGTVFDVFVVEGAEVVHGEA